MKQSLLLTLVSFFLLPPNIQAQYNPKLDSILAVLKKSEIHDTTRVDLMNEAALGFYRIAEDEKLLSYAKKAEELSQEVNYEKGQAESLRYIGFYYYGKSETRLAVRYFREALKVSLEVNDKKAAAACYNNLGATYKDVGSYDSALIYYSNALRIHKAIRYPKGIATGYNNIANVYIPKGNYTKALNSIIIAVKIREGIQDSIRLPSSYGSMGNIYGMLDKDSMALQYYKKALKIHSRNKNMQGKARNYNALGKIFHKLNKHDLAIDYLEKALIFFEETGDDFLLAESCYLLGNVYKDMGNFRQSKQYQEQALQLYTKLEDPSGIATCYDNLGVLNLAQNKYKKAYEYGQKAYALATEIVEPEIIKSSAKTISESAAFIGLFKDAYNFHVIYKNTSDSLYNKKTAEKIIALEYQYKYDKEKELMEKEQEKNLTLSRLKTEKQKRSKNLVVTILSSLIVFLLIIFLLIRRKNIEKHRKEQLQAKLEGQEAEKNRIAQELHDGIGGQISGMEFIAQSGDPDALAKLPKQLKQLGKEIRLMSRDLYNPVSRRDEFPSAVKNYIDTNFQNKDLQVHFLHEEVNFSEIRLKVLTVYFRIIQEALHNARKHAQAANIWVQLQKDNNSLTLTVEDDGKGFNPEIEAAGTGLKSLRARAQSIGAELNINSRLQKGTVISLSVKTDT
jgi:two-component system, NarL family, sensor kinase